MSTSDDRYTFVQVEFGLWERLARCGKLPNWQVVALLAYSRMGNNGHTEFCSGELARLVFPEVDTTTGEVLPGPAEANRSRLVTRLIGTAVTNGWLRAGSVPECLIVPEGMSMGKVSGKYAPCPVHRA